MVTDGTQFNKRAHLILNLLRSGNYPSSSKLAEALKCSRPTVRRVIARLEQEYGVPVKYDESEKGYYLIDSGYEMPQLLPPGKDEQTALLILTHFANLVGASDLHHKITEIWTRFSAENSNFKSHADELSKFFSCDSTSVAVMADKGILNFIQYTVRGENIKVIYKSPWRHQTEKFYQGRIRKIHYSDGNIYLLFWQDIGREFVMNTSFIKEVSVLNHDIKMEPVSSNDKLLRADDWLSGYGIWAGEDMYDIEIHIQPPAAQYYTMQVWNDNQEDIFEGEVLIRKFKGMLSPELVRQILSIGKNIAEIKPPMLKQLVLKDLNFMHMNLSS